MNKTYLRGDIFYADLGKGVGSEQEGYRPVVIIQNNVGNRHSPTVIVAAISSRTATKSKLPTHYYIGTECGLEQPSIVLLEQLRTIDKRRLNNFVGRLSDEQIKEMNHALAISIDLIDSIPKKLILCLCNTCADKFCGMGVFDLRKVESPQEKHGACANCNRRDGFNYEVIPKGR